MKLSCSSRPFASSLHAGALTQLEWLDRCIDLAVDGVEWWTPHFPRTDADYLAELKKLCVDRGLTVASLALDAPLRSDDVEACVADATAWIDRAVALGAPLVRFGCGAPVGSPGVAWRELIRGLKTLAGVAKDRNVTLALEPSEGSLVASPSECKRAMKECDSAWLRAALRLAQLRPDRADADEWRALAGDAVLLSCDAASIDADPLRVARAARYLGFVTIDQVDAAADGAALRLATATLRRILHMI
jgi:sugar phosphate isomerase/epimerase